MATRERSTMRDIVNKYERELLSEWVDSQLAAITVRPDLMKSEDLREQSRRFLDEFRKGLGTGNGAVDVNAPGWTGARDLLADISLARARQGFSPSETATFVFSLKQPLFQRMREELVKEPEAL